MAESPHGRPVLLLLCLLVLWLGAPPAPAPAAPLAREHRTTHYDLHLEGSLDPLDTGNMLEALHRELTRFFGSAPVGRLRIEIYATRERFLWALHRDGQPYEAGGGLYGPTSQKVWLAVQPTRAYTRQLILHEATHQFHFLAATRNRFPSAHWYTEGLAEFMGMANWDGRRLQVGVVPAITVEDYPEQARRRFEDLGWAVDRALDDRLDLGQAGSWAVVHFLAHRDARRFRDLGRRLDRGDEPGAAVRAVYGADVRDLVPDFRAWLARSRQPWAWQWDSWLQSGEWIEAQSDTLALSTLKETPHRLDVEIEPIAGDLRAGLVFGHHSPESFYVMTLWSDRTVRVARRHHDAWHPVDRFPIGGRGSHDVLGVEQTRNGVRLTANGRVLGVIDAPGGVGLVASRCRVRFRPRLDAAGAGMETAGASGRLRAQDTMPSTESPS